MTRGSRLLYPPWLRPVSCALAGMIALGCAPAGASHGAPGGGASGRGSYGDLVALFRDWRAFEQPPMAEGAPDYTAVTFARRREELAKLQARLVAIDARAWPIAQQIDREIVGAEMNGFDFNVRVLRPWARDPAFYTTVWTEQSDTPAHEGPTHHGLVELWTYSFPLSAAEEGRLARELAVIPPLLRHARGNLTGDARDLWVAGIKTIQQQAAALVELDGKTAASGPALRSAIRAASEATSAFVGWLEAQAPSKTGSSGVGKDAYTWSLQKVHLAPLTWDDEVAILQRELARAHTELRLEEQRNRNLPALAASADQAEFEQRGNAAVTKLIAFLASNDLMPMRGYMDAALRPHIGRFVP
ncbi:MAG TPA: hypothetical protein VGD80_02580, partial [Kofleriaceae bacterium]